MPMRCADSLEGLVKLSLMTTSGGRRSAGALLNLLGRPEAAFYLGAVGLYLFVRAGSFVYTPVRVTDTPTYEQVSAASLLSSDFWAGARPFTVPMLWKLFADDHVRIVAHLTLSIVAWLALAAAVATAIHLKLVRRLAFSLVLLFSATTEIILWDPLLLSESVSLSLAALVVAAWIWFVRVPGWSSAAAVLGATLLWAFVRDSHAYVILFVAVAVLASLAFRSRTPHKAALAAGSVVIALLSMASAGEGFRWYQPMRDILLNRVAIDRGMEDYFEARLGPNWREADARRVYARYLLAHPAYTFGDPFFGSQTTPFSSTDNASALLDPDFRIYNDNAADRALPLPARVDDAAFVHGKRSVLALVFFIAAVAAAVAFRFRASPVWIVPVVVLASTMPHGLVAYHLSGLEVDRHALEAAVFLRVGGLILALFALDALLNGLRDRRDPPRYPNGRSASLT
jgi:hypothetical protein